MVIRRAVDKEALALSEFSKDLPDSETEGLPADLSEFLELAVELVEEAVPTEHSDTLRLFDSKVAAAAAAAAAEPHDVPVGALELSPCNPWKPFRPV